MRTNPNDLAVTLLIIGVAFSAGCGPSALAPGNGIPQLKVAGWTNGGPPQDLEGNVLVLEVFATW